jgi:hypothetical protein
VESNGGKPKAAAPSLGCWGLLFIAPSVDEENAPVAAFASPVSGQKTTHFLDHAPRLIGSKFPLDYIET